MLPRESRRKADVVVSCLLIGFGALIIYSASNMPWISTRTGGSAAQWYLSPGLLPAVLGALLILFSIRVLVSAIAEGGHRAIVPTFRRWLVGLPANRKVHRVVLMTGIMGVYVFLGVGHVNYYIASSIFLAICISLFWWNEAKHNRLKFLAVMVTTSILVPLVVGYLFSNFLYVPMP